MNDYFFYSSLIIAVALIWGVIWLMIKQEERALNEWRNSEEYKNLKKEIDAANRFLDKARLDRELEKEANEPENRLYFYVFKPKKASNEDDIISGTE